MTIILEKETLDVPESMTLYELSKQYEENYKHPIIVAKVNGVIQELYHTVQKDSVVQFCTTNDKDGKRAYIRGMSMLLLKAAYKEIGKDKIENISRAKISFPIEALMSPKL